MGLTNNLGKLSNMITSTGSAVGIAQASPAYTLDVSGTGRFTGNVGIGATLSAWISTAKALQLNNTASLFAPSSEAILGNNIFVDSTDNNKYITTNYASQYRQVNGQHIFYTAASGTAGNTISFTTAMTITSAGNVGIGNTTALHKLQIGGNSDQKTAIGQSILFLSANAGNVGYVNEIGFGDVSSTYPQSAIGNIITNATAASYGDLYFATRNVTTDTAPTVRMRITSGGVVCVNATAPNGGERFNVQFDRTSQQGICINNTSNTAPSAATFIDFRYGGTSYGSISGNGTTTTYATSSDYRLKEDFKEIKGIEKINAIKVYDFKFIGTEERMDGVIAHELQDIIPYAVVGEKDGEEMQGVDYSKLVPLLVKAVQEQQIQIQNLQEQNQDLKSRLDKAGL